MRSFDVLIEQLDMMLQRDIEICHNNKVIRRGRFILYTMKDYIVTLILKTPTSNKKYEIYYPYDVHVSDKQVSLDYRLNTLSEKHSITCVTTPEKTNKLLNQQLVLRYQ